MRPLLDLILVVVGVLCVVLHVRSVRAEPRRWRAGVLLLGALWAATLLVNVGDLGVLGLPAAVAVLLGLLVAGSGLSVVTRDGRAVAHLLSLLVGLAVVAATVLGVALLRSGSTAATVVVVVVLLLPCYPALALVSYLFYCLAYVRRRPRSDPCAIVVLGSGLVEGTVPTLLALRLDAALAAWRTEQAAGRRPLVVPSGGQGDDEPVAEGVAMAAYLVAHGVPTGDVAIEDRATTTEENLLLSREILRARGLGGTPGVDGHLRVVTSGYHVGRAALLTRSLDIDADVTGAPTAWSFLPGAFVREFVAALTLHPRTSLAGLVAWVAGTAVVAATVVLS